MTIDEKLKKYEAFLWYMAHKFHIYGYTHEDLFQEFSMVLVECDKLFDPTRGVRFRTYLYKSIMARAYHLIKEQPSVDFISLDNSTGSDGRTFIDMYESPDNTPDEEDLEREMVAFIQERLTGRVGFVLEEVIVRDKTYQEVGQVLGLTKQRVQQMYAEGLKALKTQFTRRFL